MYDFVKLKFSDILCRNKSYPFLYSFVNLKYSKIFQKHLIKQNVWKFFSFVNIVESCDLFRLFFLFESGSFFKVKLFSCLYYYLSRHEYTSCDYEFVLVKDLVNNWRSCDFIWPSVVGLLCHWSLQHISFYSY